MLKIVPIIALSAVLFLIACQSASDAPDTKTEISVTGMVCEMGCGASLRKGLMETGIVGVIDIKFNEETGLGQLTLEHNSKQISSEEIVKTIEGMNDGQFSVENIESMQLSTATSSLLGIEKGNDVTLIEAEHKFLSLPDLTGLINQLLPF